MEIPLKLPQKIRTELHRLLTKGLRRYGFEIRRLQPDYLVMKDMARLLHDIRSRHEDIAVIVDVGASDGRWSARMMQHYPNAAYLLLEAQQAHAEALERFSSGHDNVEVILAAAGPELGEVFFDSSDIWGGQAAQTSSEVHSVVVPMTTLDAILDEHALPGPYLIKFDTHGFEQQILAGAQRMLAKTAVIVIECYNFRIAPQSLLFHEMCSFLGETGFRCIDMGDVMYRPHDASLWQMDLVFVRSDRPEFETTVFQ